MMNKEHEVSFLCILETLLAEQKTTNVA